MNTALTAAVAAERVTDPLSRATVTMGFPP
jgi:hypothetical protein